MTRRRYFVRLDAREVPVDVETTPDGTFRVQVTDENGTRTLSVLHAGQPTALFADGVVLELYGAADGAVTVHPGRRRLVVAERPRATSSAALAGGGETTVRAPMPGRVVKVFVEVGQTVSAGSGVAVVEAMKMENELLAPRTGRVTRVLVRAGDTVERDAALLEFE